jgi:hypothetical protein
LKREKKNTHADGHLVEPRVPSRRCRPTGADPSRARVHKHGILAGEDGEEKFLEGADGTVVVIACLGSGFEQGDLVLVGGEDAVLEEEATRRVPEG